MSGTIGTFVIKDCCQAFPSGPAILVYYHGGALIDPTHDFGDDSRFESRWRPMMKSAEKVNADAEYGEGEQMREGEIW